MNAITEARNALKAALEAEDALAAFPVLAGVTVYAEYPDRLVTPAIVIHPNEPYLTDADVPYGRIGVRLLASLITSTGANDTVTDELDELAAAAVGVLDVTEVGAPFPFTYTDTKYLAANATLDTIEIPQGG